MKGLLASFVRRPLISSRYVDDTQRPLHALIFLLPLLVAHEVGTSVWAQVGPSDYQPRVGAHVLMQWFIRLFGETTSFLPALCLVAILVAWHVASRDKWTIHVKTLAGMLAESVAFALPLLIFHSVLLAATTQSRETRLMADLVLSIGGGIYEELLFRVILFGLLTLLLVDCLGLPKDGSLVAIVLVTSGAFAAYHHLPPSVEPFHPVSFFFRTGAGVYLAGIFLFRGFGIAAGCHAAYNVAAVLIDASQTT
jgi:membrane protease YdiL (CAAX protease family)